MCSWSSRERKKNSRKMTGTKLITVPTPEKMPSRTRERTAGDTPQVSKAESHMPDRAEMPLSSRP